MEYDLPSGESSMLQPSAWKSCLSSEKEKWERLSEDQWCGLLVGSGEKILEENCAVVRTPLPIAHACQPIILTPSLCDVL